MHYRRINTGQSLDDPTLDERRAEKAKNPVENCTWRLDSGYLRTWVPKDLKEKYDLTSDHISAHRLAMILHLDRNLFDHESVHHKNGDRSDNRIENLELWSKFQPAGQRVEDKISWAKELLRQYGETL